MRIPLASLRAALGVACCAAIGCSPSHPVPSVKVVPGRALTAQRLGRLDADKELTIVVGLRLHDTDRMDRTIADIRAGRGRPLTAAEFGESFSIDEASYADVLVWASSHHLTVTRETPSHTTITLTGRVADIEEAFGVLLDRFIDVNGEFFASMIEPDFSLGALSAMSGVSGLSSARHWFSHMSPSSWTPSAVPTPPASGKGYEATDLKTLYDVPAAGATGMGAHVAILGVGAPLLDTDTLASGTAPSYNSPQLADIAAYIGSTPTTYTQVQVGSSGAADRGDSGTLTENTLDAAMVLTFAPQAQVDHVLVPSNGLGLFSDGIAFIVNDPSESTAQSVTVSYGGCEEFEGATLPVENALFAQAQAEGQQWFFASGDNGSDGCGDGPQTTQPTVGWPGSSPYVFAVGGTQINTAGGVNTEVGWGDAINGGGGGGGPSAFFAKPSWQVGTTIDDGARDVPDISALGGYPGVDITVTGTSGSVYGTSAATPMWGGIWALLVAQNANKGFTQGAIDLYTHAPTGGLVDVVGGSNDSGLVFKGYQATVGYDLSTGLGTPDVTKLLAFTGWK